MTPQLRAEAAADRRRLSDLEVRARSRWTATQKLQALRPDQRELLVGIFLEWFPEEWPNAPLDDRYRQLYDALGGDPRDLRP